MENNSEFGPVTLKRISLLAPRSLSVADTVVTMTELNPSPTSASYES